MNFLVIANISKRNNVLDLLYTASAYGLTALVVKSPRIEVDSIVTQFGGQVFQSLDEVCSFLNSRKIPLMGIEIMKESIDICDFSFNNDGSNGFAFMPGNEGTGLSKKQKDICNGFIFIPQYGHGTASLNVNIATSIVLYYLNLSIEKSIPPLK